MAKNSHTKGESLANNLISKKANLILNIILPKEEN